MSSTSSPPRPVPFAAVAAAAWGLCALQAATGAGEGLTLCPFKLLTGHACPGCGMGRAVVAAMRGQWGLSFSFHPLGLPLLLVWTAWLLTKASGPFVDRFRQPARAAWTMRRSR